MKNNIEIALVAIVAVSLIPVAIEFLRHRKEAKRDAAEAVAEAATGSVE